MAKTCEPASEAKAEHAALKKMGQKTNAAKHTPARSVPKRGGR